jgi:putative Mg2+ transporter-C (MgtC) family protein
MLSHQEMIARIVVGSALGGLIGYERDRHGRLVGLRTHILVALASASFMVISSQFAYYQHFGKDSGIEVDASRIAASVVSAIGFLAGGSILRTGATIQGLTTAAGLWLVTAIGLCAGAGMYVESVAATLLGILALTAFRRFEDKNIVKKRISLWLGEDAAATLAHLTAALASLGGVVSDIDYERRLADDRLTSLTFEVSMPVTTQLSDIIALLEKQPGVRRIHVRRSL